MNGRAWVDECAAVIDEAVRVVLDELSDDACTFAEDDDLHDCGAECHLSDVAGQLVAGYGEAGALARVASAVVGGGTWSLEFWQLMDVLRWVVDEDEDRAADALNAAAFRCRVLDWQDAGLDEASALVAAALGEVSE